MEKRTAHYSLEQAKRLMAEGHYRITRTAFDGALAMGLDEQDIVRTVCGLTRANLYKSMTTHADHKIWQDVYHPVVGGIAVYLKITVLDDVLVVSFKEL